MLSKSQITTKIASISRRRATINKDIHVVLCNIAGHVFDHGDFTAISRLLDATTGMDKKAIIKWATDYCFVRISEDGKVSINKSARKTADFTNGEAVVSYLTDTAPWYESAMTTEQAVKELDELKRLESLIKSLEKAKAEGRLHTAAPSQRDDLMRRYMDVVQPANDLAA